MRTGVSFMVILICCLLSTSATAQNASSRKFDAFNDLPTDDTQAHLDLFAQELRKDDKLQGFVVGYRSTSTLPGWHLRKIFGYLDYLANSRGVNPANVQVVDAGTARTTLTELWLVPSGAENPKCPDTSKLIPNTRFDQLQLGDGCLPEYTIELYEAEDALRFFAAELNYDPHLKGLMVVHPSREHIRQGLQLLSNSKKQLLNLFNVEPKLLMTEFGGKSVCTTLTLWVVPSTFSKPRGTTAEQFLLTRLMADAEKNRYTIRRLEFVGNTSTRDSALRKQTHELQEGEIFSHVKLRHSLASLSRLRGIYPVGIGDVDAYLNEDESTIDLTIYVRPRSRERR
jgi:hypothetical protein